ncbi:hypothetical protein E2C01_061846 [Portunus trituberculatus]|uniref:Uncharacterized protein n=1 Tax=Portunus trituberculatus TaxID=210409 RepID=A0A5B7HED6_PORTR|nr:hypothetical protein [Portunus trituberculatus]
MNELLVELEYLGIWGLSGIVDNHLSNLFLKRSGVTPVRPLMVSGSTLKRRAPFCEKQLCMQAMRVAVEVWGVQHAIIDNLQFISK